VGRSLPTLAVLQPARPAIVRGTDRRIAFGGVLVAAALLGIAGLTAIAAGPGAAPWLPLHLAMAGAASTAVAAMLPFFTAALAQVGPARPVLRISAVVLVAGGALLAGIGMNGGGSAVAVAGGATYVAGLIALAGAAFLPLRAALGSRLRIVHFAYAAAIAQVAVGVLLATAMLGGVAVVSFVGVLAGPRLLNVRLRDARGGGIALHLAPTVAAPDPSAPQHHHRHRLLIGCAPRIALAYGIGWDPVGRAGALVELVGAAALAVHAANVQRDRGRWTSDFGWHRFAGLSLLAAPFWLLVAIAIAAGRILWFGTTPEAWSVGLVAVPLVAGGIGQVLIGSWTT
jgi:hypothetical protein